MEHEVIVACRVVCGRAVSSRAILNRTVFRSRHCCLRTCKEDGDQVDVAGIFCQGFCCLSNTGGAATYNVVYARYGLDEMCGRVGFGCVGFVWWRKKRKREGEVEETLYSRASWAMRHISHVLYCVIQ